MRRIAAMVATAGLVLGASACGGSKGDHVAQLGSTATQSSVSTSASSQGNGALAFARCMRSHGVPSFPDPDSRGDSPSFHTGVSKQTSSAANAACKHLLPSGGDGRGTVTRGDQQKLTFALKVARCMRSHGFPTYPDPPSASTSSQGSGTRFEGTGIDTKSPRFQAAETACEKQERKALGLP
jgi:hypothetical protein